MLIEPLYVPFVSIYEDRLQVYDRNLNQAPRMKTDKPTNNNPTNKKYTGIMTKSGKKTIEKRLTAWLFAIECYNKMNYKKYAIRDHKPVFITLTLSDDQKHSDYFIKRQMLAVFLKDLQYNYGVVNYFWKAERQKNTRIHFHILVDKFIDKDHIQTVWNRIQNKHGYTTKYKKEYGSDNPPSTHVEGQPKNSSLIKYMLKYVSKHDNTQKIEGAVYRFSKSLLDLKPFNEIVMGSFSNVLSDSIKMIQSKEFVHDYCTIIYFSKNMSLDRLPLKLRKYIENYYNCLYHKIYTDLPRKEIIKKFKKSVADKVIQNQLFNIEPINYH